MTNYAIIPTAAVNDLSHKLKVIKPDYTVIQNAEIWVSGDAAAQNAHIVCPPYDDEERFVDVICRFASVCGVDTFFYISGSKKYIVNANGNMTAFPELVVSTENAEQMGHISAMAYGYLLHKRYCELKGIRDVVTDNE